MAAIAASIREWGWTTPALVGEDGGLIAGHARVLAARQLGIAEIPVMVAAGWTEAQKRAYVLADNQLAITGSGWDPELLRLEFGELKLPGFDLTLTGFNDLELGSLLADKTEGLTDPDDAPVAPEHPVSQTGDLWLLGRHRLLCGDSTVATDVERVLGGVEPHLMVTDPPYGVNYNADWRNEAAIDGKMKGSRRSRGMIGARAVGKVVNDDRADWHEAWALFPGDVAYVWHSALHGSDVEGSLAEAGLKTRSQIIWDKTRLVIGRGDYHWQHEPCWYAVRKGKRGQWAGGRAHFGGGERWIKGRFSDRRGNCCLVGALDFVSGHHAIKGDAAERYLAAAISDERGRCIRCHENGEDYVRTLLNCGRSLCRRARRR